MPENTVFAGRREALQAAAAAKGLELTVVEAFYDRSGKTDVCRVACRSELRLNSADV